MMKKPLGTKALVFFVMLLLFMLIGNGVMLLLLKFIGLEISSTTAIGDILKSENSTIVQIGIGINHLLLFTGTALLFQWWTSEGGVGQYFNLESAPRLVYLGLFLLLLIASYPLIGASGLIGEYLDLPEWMKTMDEDFASAMEGMLSNDSLAQLLLNLVVIALLPAIGEELIFRGIVQKELHSKISNPHVVVLATSVIFSGIHLQVQGFLPKLIISHILCYSYYWTKNLWYPIILHFFNNASMTLALYFGKDTIGEMKNMETPSFPWFGVIFSLLICTLVIRKILSMLKQDAEIDQRHNV